MNLTNAKDAFWGAVEDCLVQFHELSVDDARERRRQFREFIETGDRGRGLHIIYHDEPFYVANDLAKRELEIEPYREQYHRILDCRGW